jgi:FKBP-type peptidyl-prolyl cis-trans isomerase
MWMGMSLREEGIFYNFDYAELMRGVRDIIEGRDPRLETETAAALMQTASRESRARIAEENRRAGEAFLAENIKRAEVSVTSSGLQYEALTRGSGAHPSASDTVRLNYELSLVDGAVLGSTFAEGRPVDIPIAQVIPGFAEGIQLMPVGSTFKLYMPPALAYGEEGSAGIPPGAALVFKVELLSIVRQ